MTEVRNLLSGLTADLDQPIRDSATSRTLNANRRSWALVRRSDIVEAEIDEVLASATWYQFKASSTSTEAHEEQRAEESTRMTSVNEQATGVDRPWRVTSRWEGVVLEVGDDVFRARVQDLGYAGRDLQAEFPLHEVAPDDMPLLMPGARFYWTVGYRHSRSGRPEQVSTVRFRRIPTWDPGKRTQAERWGQSKRWMFEDIEI